MASKNGFCATTHRGSATGALRILLSQSKPRWTQKPHNGERSKKTKQLVRSANGIKQIFALPTTISRKFAQSHPQVLSFHLPPWMSQTKREAQSGKAVAGCTAAEAAGETTRERGRKEMTPAMERPVSSGGHFRSQAMSTRASEAGEGPLGPSRPPSHVFICNRPRIKMALGPRQQPGQFATVKTQRRRPQCEIVAIMLATTSKRPMMAQLDGLFCR